MTGEKFDFSGQYWPFLRGKRVQRSISAFASVEKFRSNKSIFIFKKLYSIQGSRTVKLATGGTLVRDYEARSRFRQQLVTGRMADFSYVCEKVDCPRCEAGRKKVLIKSIQKWMETENNVTSEALYLNRRKFIRGASFAGVAVGAGILGSTKSFSSNKRLLLPLDYKKTAFDPGEELTPENAVTNYNNYYEFGTSKDDPAENAWRLEPKPWSVKVDGLVDKPGTYAFEDLVDMKTLEERIYRLRCVEAWSMVVPWVGVPLSAVLKKPGPKNDAKYVAFETLADRKQMPGLRRPVLDWPYVEGLTIEEAMNDLTFIAVGLYGKEIPNQNGAPLRLVVPWKYGFKSIKSIVRIKLTKHKPPTSWNKSAPREYGFYSNVNPEVDHPRWSQARERRIGDFGRRKTLMFNGYGEQVAHLYKGLDLKANY